MNKNELKFTIFGRIIHTDYFVKQLHERGFPLPLVIVSPDQEYLRDQRLLSQYGLYGDLEELLDQGLIENLVKSDTVNNQEILALLAESKSIIGISINCRNIIKSDVINFFDGNIFNLHDSFLPNERGGALNTWRILNGINSVGNTIHYLDEGIDTGAVVAQHKSDIKKKNPNPVDYLKAEVTNCEKIVDDFLDLLEAHEKIPSTIQDNNVSLYFPRLFTEENGVINWDWSAADVEKFIRAFTEPYPGAHTQYREQKIQILESYVDEGFNQGFHPFCNGKIVTIFDNLDVRVIAGGQALVLTRVAVDDKFCKPGEMMSVKYSLNSNRDDLERAQQYIPTTKEMNVNEKGAEKVVNAAN